MSTLRIKAVVVMLGLFVFASLPVMADEDKVFGAPHEYAPFSFWSSAASFLDDPAMDDVLDDVAVAAADQGKACHDADSVRDFMAEMMAADFAALAINDRSTMTFYDTDGSIQLYCRYRYLGSELVSSGGYDVEWHKYKRRSCMPGSGWPRYVRGYRYFVATPVHQHGDGMTHTHVRYGDRGFDDLFYNPDYATWWPTLGLYGATTPETLAAEVSEGTEEWAELLPSCVY